MLSLQVIFYILIITENSQFCIKSTRAPTVYYLPKSIEKVTVLDKKEEDTSFRKIRVEYKQGQSPLEDNALTHTTTFLEDAALQSTVRIYHGNERTHGKSGRGRGGRGRGRGKGGRYVTKMHYCFRFSSNTYSPRYFSRGRGRSGKDRHR